MNRINLTDIIERAVRLYPDAPALTFHDRTSIWRTFHDRSRRLGAALRALGAGDGNRIALLSQNSDKLFEAFFGCQYADTIMVPLNYRWSLQEMLACVEDCGPDILLVDENYVDIATEIAQQFKGLRHLVFFGEGDVPHGILDYEALLAEAVPTVEPSRGNDDVAALVYTSGTTGRSKGVMLSHTNLFVNALNAAGGYVMPRLQTWLQIAPMFHLTAASRVFSLAMIGAHSVVAQRFEPVEVMSLIQKHKVNDMTFVPTMAAMVFNHPDLDNYDISSLKRINYGSAPMPERLLRTIIDRMPNVEFYQGYGATETSPLVTVLPPNAHDPDGPLASKLTSVGQPIFGVDLKIIDAEGNELPIGEVGEITVRGPTVMQGYWNNPGETARVLRDGWYRTGDGGYIDADGYVFLLDRVKDMIITGGENVYSREVEDVIHKHPAVADCAVIGVPHEIWGEAVHVVITFRPGKTVSEDDLIAWCKEGRLTPYKCPKSVEIIDEMPLSPTNKILKSELRKKHAKQ